MSLKDKLKNFWGSMETIFRKDSPRFYRANYDTWKENMKTHPLCMGLGYWILTKGNKKIVESNQS